MPEPSVPPPLKVIQTGASSYIPVFELELSGGTVTKLSPIRVRYGPTVTSGVAASRAINTTYPLSGGGDLTADRTHSVDTAFLVTSARNITASSGLSGTSNLGSDVLLSVNTNVRDKSLGFFFAGALATTSLAVNARIYIPFTMQLLNVRLAAQTAPTGASLIINPLQYNATLSASTAIFASANRPIIVAGANVGSDNATIAINSLYIGSWLGVDLDQVGSTNAGSNLTVTFITRSS